MAKILGIKKSETQTIYTFSKDWNFFEKFEKILFDLGFKSYELPCSFPSNLGINEKRQDLTKICDVYDSISNKTYSLLVIYGKDKLFLIINAKDKNMKKINEMINKTFEFKE